MNLGPFCKDIWELIFSYFELNFCRETLNSLSLTCKKLNCIDNERRRRHSDSLIRKCELLNFDTNKILNDPASFHPGLSKSRPDYASLYKYIDIDLINIRTKKLLINKTDSTKDFQMTLISDIINNNPDKTMIRIFPQLHSYLRKLNVNGYEELSKMNDRDMCLKLNICYEDVEIIFSNGISSFIFAAFFCIKHDSDIVNAILDCQNFI